VDVDLGHLKLVGLRGRLSCIEGFHHGGRMACSVDMWTRISGHPTISYPGLQNASVRVTCRALTLLRFLMSSLSVIRFFTSSLFVSKLVFFEFQVSHAIQVLPLAATRIHTFFAHHTPFALIIMADGLYLSSGLLNVLLYAYTRPFLLPHANDSSDGQSIVIHSEFTQSRSDLPGSTTNTRVDSSLFEPKLADPVYDSPEVAHHQLELGALPIMARNSDRDIDHDY
jgi:hypothetical protein